MQMKRAKNIPLVLKLGLGLALLFLFLIWTRGGLDTFFLDTDFGRDLSELSNLWIGRKIIWLGPRLSPGLHASSIYYYVFYPALWLSQGNAYSLLVFNLLIAVSVLGIFGYFALRKWGKSALLTVLLVGLVPWWRSTTMHPGNGYTFVFWLFLSLTLLWFELPLFLSALFLGLSISYHPAAIFALLILFYEWWRRGHSLRSLLFIFIGLLAPWAPIILFEVITRGYITQHWLANPGIGIKYQLGIENIQQIIAMSGLTVIAAVLIWVLVGIITSGRTRVWFVLTNILLISFFLLSRVPPNYLFGILSLLWLVTVIALANVRWGALVMGILIILFLGRDIISAPPPTPARRPISRIHAVVDKLVEDGRLEKNKKIAVVSVLGKITAVPQADDYRFFLRMKGYQVLVVQLYTQADTLIMFVEEPGFNWSEWSTWEIDQFGKKKADYQINTEGVKIVVFEKAV